MHTIVNLHGLRAVEVSEVGPGHEPAAPPGSILIQCTDATSCVHVILPRALALSLHAGLDSWARAITEETDHGPKPSAN